MNQKTYVLSLGLLVFILLLSGLWVTSWYLSFKLIATGALTFFFGLGAGELCFKGDN